MIEDIEDISFSVDSSIRHNENEVRKRVVRNSKPQNREKVEADSIIPGTQVIYVRTWGCTHNNSDSEYMAGLLSTAGYIITDDKLNADLWLLNSCTVKNPAEDHFRNEIETARKCGKYIVVAGCVPQGAQKVEFLKGLSAIGVQQIDRVVEVVQETLKGHSVRLFGQKKKNGKKLGGASLDLPKVRRNKYIEIIPINTGCLNKCTYCKTKHARGNLGSYHPEEIINRAKQAFEEGVVELWLTSEDTGAYGRDIGSSLPQLLQTLIPIVPKNCMIRIGMTNPPYILEHLEKMVDILLHPNVYSFMHIPVQSGSDNVLAEMKREYTISEFMKVVDFLKNGFFRFFTSRLDVTNFDHQNFETSCNFNSVHVLIRYLANHHSILNVPGITIATDIICGFPTETDDDFEETMDLCKTYKFPSLFINQFYPRPGTPAARLPRIPAYEVKKRTKRLCEYFQSYQPYEHKINEIYDVLVTEEASDGFHYVGHNKFYEQILVPKNPELMGKFVTVKIVKTMKHCMIGEIQSRFTYLRAKFVKFNEKLDEGYMDPSTFLMFYMFRLGPCSSGPAI